MIINDENYMEGNNALASVLLLYYHLAIDGCFCGDETVYIAPELFEGFRFLDVVVEESYQPEIDEDLLREAAVIYLLCDLNDMITEHEESFRHCEFTRKIIEAYNAGRMSAIPEVDEIFTLLESSETDFDFERYSGILREIYSKYVLSTFSHLAVCRQP